MANWAALPGLALLLPMSTVALAQTPAFDVASIKVHKPVNASEGGNRERIEAAPGSLTMRNVNLLSCVRWAFDVREYQVSGPAGLTVERLTGERYDILAKVDPPVLPARMREMLQTLLAQRFRLQAHHEKKARPVYLLTVAKGGPKLPHAEPGGNSAMFRSDGSFIFRARSMQQFADDLSGLSRVGRPVLDQTGIPGLFDFSLKFGETGDEMKRALNEGDGAALFTLVQEQLGLKIEGRRAPVDILVVDHVDRDPAEN